MKITLHPGAEQDIQEAAAFYEREGSSVLAARFVAEFKRLSNLLIEHPGIGLPAYQRPTWLLDERLSVHRDLSRRCG